jgi:hypothetical protein
LGASLVVTSNVADAPTFHEPISGTDSWIVGRDTVRLPSAGKYYVVAWSASALPGKAWVAVGTREAFSWSDLATLPTVLRDVRTFHELGPDPRLAAAAKALFLAGAASLIALLALL